MLNLTEKGVEVFIKKAKNIDPFWDNYDLVIWKQNKNGYTDTKGMFRNNNWGMADRITVNEKGTWKLPIKYVKYFK